MIRRFLLAVACASAPLGGAHAQEATAFDPQARVTEALELVRPIAMTRDAVDWPAVEARARAMAAEARDTVDLLPAYQLIVWSLHDDHSSINVDEAVWDEWDRRSNGGRLLPDTPPRRVAVSELRNRPVSHRDLLLPNGAAVRVVVVPAYGGGDEDGAFAASITAALADRPGACGYVVDLRGNTGGNMFPMVGGLWPLFGADFSWATAAGPGLTDAVVRLEDGNLVGYVTPDSEQGVRLAGLPTWSGWDVSAAPVAILVDGATSSSGEAVALLLVDRGSSRLFGQRTYGATSLTHIQTLSDGVTFTVAIEPMRDASGRTFPGGIPPHETVEAGPGAADDPDDAVEEAAKGWLADQEACQG